jgi:hypothetical protein
VFRCPISRLDFAGFLAALQELLGNPLEILIYLPGDSFSAGFRTRLERIVELPPDRLAVTLVFEDDHAVTVAPEEVSVFCGVSTRSRGRTRWIEVQVHNGICLLIEETPRSTEMA